MRDNGAATRGDSDYMNSLKVTDDKTLDFLNRQDVVTTYKTMQIVDGKLYPPIAARVNGKHEDYSELGTKLIGVSKEKFEAKYSKNRKKRW